MKMLLTILQSVLALVVAFMALGLVNLAAAWVLNAALPGSLDAEGLPLTTLAQGLYLPILFVAGMVGAFLVVFGAPRGPVMHAVVFGGLALLGDVIVVRDYAAIWATWFSILVLVTVPPQVWLGGVLGMRARRRWAPWARAGSTGASANVSLASEQTLALPIESDNS